MYTKFTFEVNCFSYTLLLYLVTHFSNTAPSKCQLESISSGLMRTSQSSNVYTRCTTRTSSSTLHTSQDGTRSRSRASSTTRWSCEIKLTCNNRKSNLKIVISNTRNFWLLLVEFWIWDSYKTAMKRVTSEIIWYSCINSWAIHQAARILIKEDLW